MSDTTFAHLVSGMLTAITYRGRVHTVASASVCTATGNRVITLVDGRVLTLAGAR